MCPGSAYPAIAADVMARYARLHNAEARAARRRIEAAGEAEAARYRGVPHLSFEGPPNNAPPPPHLLFDRKLSLPFTNDSIPVVHPSPSKQSACPCPDSGRCTTSQAWTSTGRRSPRRRHPAPHGVIPQTRLTWMAHFWPQFGPHEKWNQLQTGIQTLGLPGSTGSGSGKAGGARG